jgi:isoquinoline 1-oxidoreductase beta subunit
LYHWVVVAPNNTVTIRIAQVEMGQGTATAMAQLLAEELEADWSKVQTEFVSLTTDLERDQMYGQMGTAASLGVKLREKMLRLAGAQIKTMLIEAAALRLDVPKAELVAVNSTVIHYPECSMPQ